MGTRDGCGKKEIGRAQRREKERLEKEGRGGRPAFPVISTSMDLTKELQDPDLNLVKKDFVCGIVWRPKVLPVRV
jgi:hypothetical protein